MTTIKLSFASALLLLVLQASSAADNTHFAQCPAIGYSTSCNVLISVDPDGNALVALDPTVRPLDGPIDGSGEDVLIGVQNNASLPLLSLDLVGGGIFSLDGDGLCSYSGNPFTSPPMAPAPAWCTSSPGLTGYEGPNNTFNFSGKDSGTVVFTNPIALGGTAYFSLEGPPQILTATARLDPPPVPEPSSLVLLATGLAAVTSRRSRLWGRQR